MTGLQWSDPSSEAIEKTAQYPFLIFLKMNGTYLSKAVMKLENFLIWFELNWEWGFGDDRWPFYTHFGSPPARNRRSLADQSASSLSFIRGCGSNAFVFVSISRPRCRQSVSDDAFAHSPQCFSVHTAVLHSWLVYSCAVHKLFIKNFSKIFRKLQFHSLAAAFHVHLMPLFWCSTLPRRNAASLTLETGPRTPMTSLLAIMLLALMLALWRHLSFPPNRDSPFHSCFQV